MNTNENSFPDLQSILGGGSGDTKLPSLIDTDAIIASLMPMMIILTIISVAITLLYILSLVQRIRVDRATLETRNILREMNERDKARGGVPALPADQLPPTTPIEKS